MEDNERRKTTKGGYPPLGVIPIKGYHVASWCPGADGKNPTQVHFMLELPDGGVIGMRFKSRRAVEELVDLLLEYAGEVWPKPV